MDISPKSVFFTLCLSFLLLDAGPVAAQQLQPTDSWLDEVIQPALRSLPREKFDPKSKPRTSQPRTTKSRDKRPKLGKPRLGFKVQFGGGLALGVPEPGFGAGVHAGFGFYLDHFAIMYGGEIYGGKSGGFQGHFLEVEIYDQSRRRSLDSYLIVGGGIGTRLDEGLDLDSAVKVFGPAALIGYGVNLFGGEIPFPRLFSGGYDYPYFALHARLPAMAWVTPEGVGIGATATLVLEIAYQ